MKGKVMTDIQLFGVDKQGKKCSSHNAEEVFCFTNNKVKVECATNNNVAVTSKGETTILKKHQSIDNLWVGVIRGYRTHFSKKKLVASLRYWS